MHAEATNRQWILARRPLGLPRAGDFEMRLSPVPVPGEGEILLRVLYLAMDPAIRGFMNAAGNYAAPVPLGDPVRGMVLGRVVESQADTLTAGDIVWGFGSWSDYTTAPADQLHRLPSDLPDALPSHLHARGTIGLTAHYGLFGIAGLASGENILISGSAGAVGSLAGQMARIAGAGRIVGIAGGPAKCARAVERYGYDVCIDYKAETDLAAAIGDALPNGIDVCFDSVGGAVLEGAIGHLRKDGRVALCGMISGYNATEPVPGPSNLWNLVVNTAGIQGFRVTDLLRDRDSVARTLDEISGWIEAGLLLEDFDIRNGFDAVPESFLCLFSGAHDGRLLVRLTEE